MLTIFDDTHVRVVALNFTTLRQCFYIIRKGKIGKEFVPYEPIHCSVEEDILIATYIQVDYLHSQSYHVVRYPIATIFDWYHHHSIFVRSIIFLYILFTFFLVFFFFRLIILAIFHSTFFKHHHKE